MTTNMEDSDARTEANPRIQLATLLLRGLQIAILAFAIYVLAGEISILNWRLSFSNQSYQYEGQLSAPPQRASAASAYCDFVGDHNLLSVLRYTEEIPPAYSTWKYASDGEYRETLFYKAIFMASYQLNRRLEDWAVYQISLIYINPYIEFTAALV